MYYKHYTVFLQNNNNHFPITILSASCSISHTLTHNNELNVLAAKRHGPALQAVSNFEELWLARYDNTEGSRTVHTNFICLTLLLHWLLIILAF